MLKATDADNAVESFVFEAEVFGEAVNVACSRSVQLLCGTECSGIGLQPVRRFEVTRETFCPEAVTAADIEQCTAGRFIGAPGKQRKFAISIERTIAADCAIQAIQDTHFQPRLLPKYFVPVAVITSIVGTGGRVAR